MNSDLDVCRPLRDVLKDEPILSFLGEGSVD